jgi:hypothetical protein
LARGIVPRCHRGSIAWRIAWRIVWRIAWRIVWRIACLAIRHGCRCVCRLTIRGSISSWLLNNHSLFVCKKFEK